MAHPDSLSAWALAAAAAELWPTGRALHSVRRQTHSLTAQADYQSVEPLSPSGGRAVTIFNSSAHIERLCLCCFLFRM